MYLGTSYIEFELFEKVPILFQDRSFSRSMDPRGMNIILRSDLLKMIRAKEEKEGQKKKKADSSFFPLLSSPPLSHCVYLIIKYKKSFFLFAQ